MSSNLPENQKENTNKEDNEPTPNNKIELQLGDIIKIIHPKNERLNDIDFFIQYIDSTKMALLNPDTNEVIKLKISPEGIIGDGNIQELILLSRSDSASYAIQNGLTSGKWINIHFGGEYPVIITGEITNLENDMIEVKTVDGDTLYINFDYKGIPEDLPIEFIEIRAKPSESRQEEQRLQEEEQEQEPIMRDEWEELEREQVIVPTERLQIGVPVNNIKNKLNEIILRADQIQFGNEVLGPIRQFVDVEKEKQRYSIDEQVSDLLDDLLSTIPNAQRTQKVLNNIHIIIERFKQLREHFSTKDEYGNIDGLIVYTANYKPLIKYFYEFKQNLYWLLPVVKNVKKIYNAGIEDIEDETTDIVNLDIDTDIRNIIDIINQYKSNSNPLEQNKYLQLYTDLNPFFTPFELVYEENKNTLLAEKYVKGDINVIIDNLEDMYSSIFTNNNIRSRKFVIQKYINSLTKLDTIESQGSKTTTVVVNMTPADMMSIKSILTLPEPVVRFSKINLPETNILDKANLNLHFFNYWQFLKKSSHVNNVFVENLDQDIEFREDNFVNSIKNYALSLSEEEKKGLTQDTIYREFLQKIIPKTRVLFQLMKKYIKGKLSIVDVVSYLEPFLVYTEDLTYMQYVDILTFISEQISAYNKDFIERSRIFVMLKKARSQPSVFSNAYSLLSMLETKDNIRDEVISAYDIADEKMVTNSEILRKFVLKDASRLYTSALSLQSLPLMFPAEFASLFEKEQQQMNKSISQNEDKSPCKTMIVAKQYYSKEELEADNNRTIYFDKKFDKTNYGLLDNYEKDMMRMSPENFISYLTEELRKKEKLSDDDAEYLAETLIDGHKKVINGQYAVVIYASEKDEVDYFVRSNNQWVLDTSVDKSINTTDPDLLCNLQEKCISVPSSSSLGDKCESITVDAFSLQNKILKEVVNEFDTKYRMSKEETERKVREDFDYSLSIMPLISKMETTNMLKYNNQKYKLGVRLDDETISHLPVSPYAKLLNLILGQKDFVKKQNDIVRFVNTYTRPPILEGFGPLNKRESEYWRYCIKTNVELIPVFRFEMANAFIVNPAGYNEFVELLISRIGKESDDGDSWTALGSGWTIRKAEFDVEEGYQDGFRVSSRAILEEDVGNQITSAIATVVKYDTPETRMINNIVNTLSIAMGINIETQKEFVINGVLDSMRSTLESEQDYKLKIKEMAEKGKKIMSYKDFYNTALMYYTLGMFLIAVQTAVPSIKTRKTHPGCVRSFDGFPFSGTGDFSSLNYLTCVAYDIRESGEPWNVLKKKEIIEAKIKAVVTDVLLVLPEVKRKFEEKTDYLLLSPGEKIPDEHDIANWVHFLPPLFPFKIKKLLNISDEFKKELISDLRNGSPRQREKLLVIDSKIIQFSLTIQEKIQHIVKQKNALLKNSNNEPYLENACCQTREGETTIGYFIEHDLAISEYNGIVKKLTDILLDVISYTKSGLFCSEVNTKNKYPPVSQQFDEKTIYLAFIYFCKFKTLMPIPEDLLPLCVDKPDYQFLTANDSVDEMIRKLKENGRHYTNETFLRLLQVIGRHSIVNIDTDIPVVSSLATLNNVLESIDDENDDVVDGSFRNKMQNALNTFDIATKEMSPDVRELNNYLIHGIRSMKEDIIDFIEKNRGSTVTTRSVNKAKNIIQTLSSWNIDKSERTIGASISNDSMYTIIQFYRTFVDNFTSLFPNIIENKVDYNNTIVPRYMKLSQNHSNKISGYIKKYYEELKVFYGNEKLSLVLSEIQKTAKNLERLAHYTPCFTSIQYGDELLKPIFDERTSKMLYEYYLLRVLVNYMDLSDEEDMIVTVTSRPENVQDIFSTDYLEETETRATVVETVARQQMGVLSGNRKELHQLVAQLMIAYLNILDNEKDTIDISYEQIRDNIFKLREREKDMITDRLKGLTDETREIDTILKINKLGVWSKGLQKGLTIYDKEMYEEEGEFRDEMEKAERNIRKKNHNATSENIEQYLEDYLEEQQRGEDIEAEAYDLDYLNEDYYEGNFDGNDAPEEEYDDYRDYD